MNDGLEVYSDAPDDAPDETLHDSIARLEARIDQLTDVIENCRKFVLAGRLAMVAGVLLFVPGFIYSETRGPTILISAIVALIGGIVVSGSNRSTAKQASDELSYLKSQRAALIDRLDLRVVGHQDSAVARH